MSKIQDDSYLSQFGSIWPIWLAVGTALVFALGYVKLLAFSVGLFGVIPPTVMHGPTQILTTGIIGFLGRLITPLLLFCLFLSLGRAKDTVKMSVSYSVPWFAGSFVLLCILWVTFFWIPHQGYPHFFAQIFEAEPISYNRLSNRELVIAFWLILFLICGVVFYEASHHRYRLALGIFVGWCVVYAFVDGAVFAHRMGRELRCADTSMITQNVALHGTIITKVQLSPTSESESASQERFLTKGTLLAKFDGDYYFSSISPTDQTAKMGHAGHCEAGALVIVPAEQFLGFRNNR